MTAHFRGITHGEPAYPFAVYPAKHPLPAENIEAFAGDVVVYTPAGNELNAVLNRARIDLPGLAEAGAVYRVMSHNPDSLWAIARRTGFNAAAPAVDGFIAFLMLNRAGLQQLVAGTFDASNPDLSLLAPKTASRPAFMSGRCGLATVWSREFRWRSIKCGHLSIGMRISMRER